MPAPRKKISYQEFLHREYEFFHAPLAPEMDFYGTIRSGNIRKVRALLSEPFHKKTGLGVLSDNPLQNLKYHMTITTALVARFCISGGLSQSEAYSLSDYYIRLADEASTPEEISEIHNEMCLHYAKQMLEVLGSTEGLVNPYGGFAPERPWRPETGFERKGLEKDYVINEVWVEKA